MACMAVIALVTTIVSAEEPVPDAIDEHMTAEDLVREEFGLGISVGERTGLSAKKWTSNTPAIDVGAAWSFIDIKSFQVHADYLRHNYDLIKTTELPGRLSCYYGVGGRIKLKGGNAGISKESNDEDSRLGLRVPLGLSYVFKENPIEIFTEVVPILDIVPEARSGVGFGIGARYYFALR